MGGPETYFVKDGYVCNETAVACGKPEAGPYWTGARIPNSAVYQHNVYELAGAIARKQRLQTGLDIGCGPATKSAVFLAPVLEELVLMDHPECRSLVADTLPGAQFLAIDLESCRVQFDRTVDLVVCADVLEHLSDPSACLDFAMRHLAGDGIAIFSTPERDVLRGPDCMNSPHPDHVREWNREEFGRLLEWKGFRVIRRHLFPAARLSAPQESLRRLSPEILRPRHWRSCQVAVCRR